MTLNPELQKNNELLQQFKETRNRTLELVKNLEKDDFVVQTAPYMSPPKWHIGHVSWIYEAIIWVRCCAGDSSQASSCMPSIRSSNTI